MSGPRQQVLYEGTPVRVLAMLENAVILARDSGAQFTTPLNDERITIVDLPSGEAGLPCAANEPAPGDAQDVLGELYTDDSPEDDQP